MDVLTAVATLVTIIGIVAAAYAVVQWRDRNEARIPLLLVRTSDGVSLDEAGLLRLTLVNNGGRAVKFLVVLHAGNAFFYFVGTIGDKTRDDFAELPVSQATSTMNSVVTVAVAAYDADKRWWDQLTRPKRIKQPINDWLTFQCRRYGHGCPHLTAPAV